MIKLSNIKLYGDENIGMYFGSRMKGNAAKVHREWGNELEGVYGFNNKAAHIGLYQGEIDFSAKIGEKLTIDNQNQHAWNSPRKHHEKALNPNQNPKIQSLPIILPWVPLFD